MAGTVRRPPVHLFKHYELDEAQGLVEYSLIMLLVAMVAITGLAFLGTTVLEFLQGFGERIGGMVGD